MIVGFATGTGRCGTHTFGAQMQRLSGVIGVHEGRQQVIKNKRYIKHAPHLCCDIPGAIQWNLDALEWRRAQYGSGKNRAYCEGAHYFALNLDIVEQIFPEARIIHLVREPVTMTWSMIQHGGPWIYKDGFHKKSVDRWKRWPDCFPNYDDVTNQAEGYAKFWQHVNETLEHTHLPRLLVHTEELGDAKTWRKILHFLGLDDLRVEVPHLVFNARHHRRKVVPPPKYVYDAVAKFCSWKPHP